MDEALEAELQDGIVGLAGFFQVNHIVNFQQILHEVDFLEGPKITSWL